MQQQQPTRPWPLKCSSLYFCRCCCCSHSPDEFLLLLKIRRAGRPFAHKATQKGLIIGKAPDYHNPLTARAIPASCTFIIFFIILNNGDNRIWGNDCLRYLLLILTSLCEGATSQCSLDFSLEIHENLQNWHVRLNYTMFKDALLLCSLSLVQFLYLATCKALALGKVIFVLGA